MTDSNFCQQRTIMQLYNKPLPRFDLNSINPYLSGKFTKEQLDMRRKAEILKYSANRSSTQTNNLTKRQQFSMLARGSYVQPNQSTLLLGNIGCSDDKMTPTPTSASDVPGKVGYLYNDETVPLYNFASFNVRPYSDYVPTDSNPWQFISQPDVSFNNTTTESITNYLIMYNSINEDFYTYKITIPVGIFVYGTSKIANLPGKITLRINSASLRSYYNQTIYGTYSSPVFDTSMNLVFDVSNSTPGQFNATYFAGNMTFSGVRLYATPGFVYSFAVVVNIGITVANDVNYNTASYFGTDGLKYGHVINMSANTNSKNGKINVLSYSSGTANLGSFITRV